MKDSEMQYREIFDKSPIGILFYDKKGKLTDANPSALEIAGVPSLNDCLGHNLFDNPDVESRKEELLNNGLIKFQTPLNFDKGKKKSELHDPQKSGTTFIDHTVSTTDSGYLMQIQDITVSKKAEKTLKESVEEVSVNFLLDNVAEAIIICDSNFIITGWNKGAEEIYGWKAEEAIGKTTKFLKTRYPSGNWKAEVNQLIKDGKWSGEIESTAKDGRILSLWVSASLIKDEFGKTIGSISVTHDFTGRKKTEEALKAREAQLQAIIENLDEGLVVSDMDGTLIHWNHAAIKMHGFSNIEEGIRKFPEFTEIFELSTMGGNVLSVDQWPAARILRGEHLKDFEVYIRRINNNWERIFSYGGILVRNPQDQPLMAIITLTDITERKQAEEALRDYSERLDLAQKVSNVGTFEWNIQTGVNTWTPELEAMYGLKEGEFPGTQEAWEELVHPEDMPEAVHRVEIALETGEPVEGEWRVIWPDGSMHWLFGRWQVFRDNDGKPLKMIGVNINITERKKAEEKLKQSEERLSLAQSSANVGIWDWNIHTGEVKWTEELEKIYGYEEGAFRGNYDAFSKRVHPDDLDEVERMRDEAINAQIPFDYDFRIITPSNVLRWVNTKGAAIYDSSGNPQRVFGVNIDITERKEAEEQIRKLLEESQQAAEELEVSNEELQSTTEELQTANEKFRHQGDELLRVNQVLRQSREDMDRAQEVGQIGSWRLDVRRNVLTWSDENHRIFGVPKGTPMTYETFLGIIHPDDRQYVDTQWNVGLAGEPYDIEHRIVVDGQVKWVREKAYLEFDDEGMVLGGFGITQDITERKKAEEYIIKMLEKEKQLSEELQQQMKYEKELINKLKTSNKELEQFAYVASHDLQEPLRMVASFSQLLQRRYKDQIDEDANDYIEFIVEGANRMKDLIDDLLAFSRLNTEAKEFKLTDINNVLDDVLVNLNPSIVENNAQITHDPLPIIKVDSSQIRQLLQNLISNAIKFHGDKPPKIHISAKESGKEWLFSVSDNGIGIDTEHLEKIFNVFNRLHTREEYEGTGIGLAICKRIINRHEGRIWVESEEGKGSTFYFTIPKSEMDINPK